MRRRGALQQGSSAEQRGLREGRAVKPGLQTETEPRVSTATETHVHDIYSPGAVIARQWSVFK